MAKLKINETKKVSHIAPEIYGHFSEHLGRGIYEGLFVKPDSGIENENGMRKDVVEALKALKVPVLRWPGGCFADEYHWRDGIGPKETRKKMINTHWGGVIEDNSFGTHEFFELCRQLGCKTYVNGNVGSGSVREMSEWVEYMTFGGVSPLAEERAKNGHPEPWKVDYFGVGNENWGGGGNMTPEFYANLYRQYQTYIRQYNHKAPIQKICGGANVADDFWTKGVLKTCFQQPHPEWAHGFMDGLSLHYYVHPQGWEKKGSATEFDEEEYYTTMRKALYMEDLIKLHGSIMDAYDPEKKIGMIVDEWGGWYNVEPGTNPGFLYQQNTVRDALIAGVTLNIFNKHSDRVRMACLAQMVNVLQSVILTEGEKMLLTPTYHVMHMYRHHQDAELVESKLSGVRGVGTGESAVPQIQESVSVDKNGVLTVTMVNMSTEDSETVAIELAEAGYHVTEAKIVTGASVRDYNTFDDSSKVCERDFDGVVTDECGLRVTLPAVSVVELRLSKFDYIKKPSR